MYSWLTFCATRIQGASNKHITDVIRTALTHIVQQNQRIGSCVSNDALSLISPQRPPASPLTVESRPSRPARRVYQTCRPQIVRQDTKGYHHPRPPQTDRSRHVFPLAPLPAGSARLGLCWKDTKLILPHPLWQFACLEKKIAA